MALIMCCVYRALQVPKSVCLHHWAPFPGQVLWGRAVSRQLWQWVRVNYPHWHTCFMYIYLQTGHCIHVTCTCVHRNYNNNNNNKIIFKNNKINYYYYSVHVICQWSSGCQGLAEVTAHSGHGDSWLWQLDSQWVPDCWGLVCSSATEGQHVLTYAHGIMCSRGSPCSLLVLLLWYSESHRPF